MYLEYACYNELNEVNVQAQVFNALEHNIQGVSIPHVFLSKIAPIIPHGITVSCPVDWPLGRSSTQIRNHTVIHAINQGANAIDLVSNHILYMNNIKEYICDLVSNQGICKDRGVTLRVMLEYRVMENKDLSNICKILVDTGIEYFFPSSGYRLDNWIDNAVIAHKTQHKFNLQAISNGNIFTLKHYEEIEKSDVYGMRFHHIKSVDNILAGV